MKVAFVLSVHLSDDERVWYQEAKSLSDAGCEVFVVTEDWKAQLLDIQPNVLICDHPGAIILAYQYKRHTTQPVRIIYDVTEWYPSKKYLRGASFLKTRLKFIALIAIVYCIAWLVDGFIFGEYYKARPFRCLFPWKKYVYLSYYADPQQITTYPFRDISKQCVLLYAGTLTKEKGFDRVIHVAQTAAIRFSDTRFTLRILSKEEREIESNLPNLEVQVLPFLPFPDFCAEIGKADIFLDLRSNDIENTHCLPIKLFYYMAAQRPVIYSNLRAIKKEVPEITQAGLLVNPNDINTIVSQIGRYIHDKTEYQRAGQLARQLTEAKYNWARIAPTFVQFITQNGNV
ncbi:MAG: glycosyltransferase [Candidatus Symbiothrix sp.]|jgi:glycosyltransferase involved in cell wall biosynthesis|nr:glycosyltransferase [Candidatus Symbiothrix sp.]